MSNKRLASPRPCRGEPTAWLLLIMTVTLLAAMAGCADDSTKKGQANDGGTDTGEPDTDSWIDEYSMPFDVEPFQWLNVPGGLDQPTAETFAGRVLLILFFQKW